MKPVVKSFVASFALIFFLSLGVHATERNKKETVSIHTSAICESCQKRIEKSLLATPGVEAAVLNLNNKKVKVKYDPLKINPDQIRLVISNTGYDADDVKRNEAAYKNLPDCCQQPMKACH